MSVLNKYREEFDVFYELLDILMHSDMDGVIHEEPIEVLDIEGLSEEAVELTSIYYIGKTGEHAKVATLKPKVVLDLFKEYLRERGL